MALPCAVIAVSVAMAPWITSVRDIRERVPPLPRKPVLLYRHDATSFFYTSADLLHPEELGEPGEFLRAVLIDVFPMNEGQSSRTLSWATNAFHAVVADDPPSLAAEIGRSIGGPPTLSRGDVKVVPLPADSRYRARSGLQAFVTMAVRSFDKPLPAVNAAPIQFAVAADNAFRALHERGIQRIGIGLMPVPDRIGQPVSRPDSWSRILAAADAAGIANDAEIVVFGGWGMLPQTRQATDAAFRSAWEGQRRTLQTSAREIAHERPRLVALLALAALLRWRKRRNFLRFGRVVALGVLAAGLTVTLVELAHYLVMIPPAIVFLIECVLAIAAGIGLERIVAFDPKKEIEPEKEGAGP
jgi:hypothetical protein